ncbi:MAG: arylamine N-acetyltransferase [Oculatellaceae cyanobacterium bins.114]|nr:arylamine N-acetyltransferase [Oculatellaceae cyanobacterium bins.114]
MQLQQRPTEINLDAYFQRIGYSGDALPTLATLQAIHQHHVQAIAFENLTPLLKQPVLLDLASLQQKLIHERRGGYCFEQNSLLRSVLLALGFQVTALAARVLWNVPEGTITPRTHMVLRVDIDGRSYIADVGFGGLTLTTPLALIPDVEQQTSHEPFRLLAVDHTYIMQALIKQEWKSLYKFDLQEQQLPDYEVSNWYVSTHPNSLFVNHLIVAKPDLNCRYALQDNQFTVHYLEDQTEHRVLSMVTELCVTLEEIFGLNLEATINLEQTLQQLIERSP